jgi:choline dehydrogenase-like flavoprotein
MGIDQLSVVDPALRVHGVRSLRIADASVMPLITSANTQAPTLVIAERAAENVLGAAAGGRAGACELARVGT